MLKKIIAVTSKQFTPDIFYVRELYKLELYYGDIKVGKSIELMLNLYAGSDSKFVEIGSGIGRLYAMNEALAARCLCATDIKPVMLEQHKESRGVTNTKALSITELPQNFCDLVAIVGTNVLDCIPMAELKKNLVAIYDSLAQGGVLIHSMDMNASIQIIKEYIFDHPEVVVIRERLDGHQYRIHTVEKNIFLKYRDEFFNKYCKPVVINKDANDVESRYFDLQQESIQGYYLLARAVNNIFVGEPCKIPIQNHEDYFKEYFLQTLKDVGFSLIQDFSCHPKVIVAKKEQSIMPAENSLQGLISYL